MDWSWHGGAGQVFGPCRIQIAFGYHGWHKNDLAAPKPAQGSILGAQPEKLLLVVGSIKHEFSAAWDEVVSLLLKYGS
jgi:hypothetical protein